jgi:hypothetical protein
VPIRWRVLVDMSEDLYGWRRLCPSDRRSARSAARRFPRLRSRSTSLHGSYTFANALAPRSCFRPRSLPNGANTPIDHSSETEADSRVRNGYLTARSQTEGAFR